MEKYTIAIDCDDAATDLKNVIYEYLKGKGASITDLEYSANKSPAYYPEIGYNLAKKIQQGDFDRGILICGTGLGMAMIANKVEGVFLRTRNVKLKMFGSSGIKCNSEIFKRLRIVFFTFFSIDNYVAKPFA